MEIVAGIEMNCCGRQRKDKSELLREIGGKKNVESKRLSFSAKKEQKCRILGARGQRKVGNRDRPLAQRAV